MQKAINRFLAHLTEERDASQNTVSAYRTDLGQFLSYLRSSEICGETNTWQSVDTGCIEAYLDHMENQSYAASTVARKIASVKSFVSHLQVSGQITHNPAGDIKPPKVEKPLPRPIAPEEIDRLLAEPGKQNTPRSLRDKALLEVLYATGMRVSELVGLDVEDVDVETGSIQCGVRSHQRTIPVRDKATEALQRYLARARRSLVDSADEVALFVNHRGQRLTRQGLWLILREYTKAVGIDFQVTPYTLRHSIATHLLDAGANLKEVQKRLGHVHASTTQVYRKVSDEQSQGIVVDGKVVDDKCHEMNG